MRFFRVAIVCLLAFAPTVLVAPGSSFAQIAVGLSVRIAPPPLPVYAQPPIPGPGYLWTPGFWGYGSYGYYWAPGTWARPPAAGLLWTPGYWGAAGGAYAFHAGYWGAHVGFYGGVSYGFGYTGVGYQGGYWNHGAFNYNRSVNNIGNTTNISNTYNKNVTVNRSVSNTSYNGGTGGVQAQPTPAETAAASEQHVPPTAAQTQHVQAASTNRALLASTNHGTPPIAATQRPGEFSGKGVVPAHGAVASRQVSPAAQRPAGVTRQRPVGTAATSPADAGPHSPPPARGAAQERTVQPTPQSSPGAAAQRARELPRERAVQGAKGGQPAQPRARCAAGEPGCAAAERGAQ